MTWRPEEEEHDREERENDLTTAIGHLWAVCGELRDEMRALRDQLAAPPAAAPPADDRVPELQKLCGEAAQFMYAVGFKAYTNAEELHSALITASGTHPADWKPTPPAPAAEPVAWAQSINGRLLGSTMRPVPFQEHEVSRGYTVVPLYAHPAPPAPAADPLARWSLRAVDSEDEPLYDGMETDRHGDWVRWEDLAHPPAAPAGDERLLLRKTLEAIQDLAADMESACSRDQASHESERMDLSAYAVNFAVIKDLAHAALDAAGEEKP